MIAYEWWQRFAFDEQLYGVEDYYWALQCMQAGGLIHHLACDVDYLRVGNNRLLADSARVRWISKQVGVPVHWLGTRSAIQRLGVSLPAYFWSAEARREVPEVMRRLVGYHLWRLYWKAA